VHVHKYVCEDVCNLITDAKAVLFFALEVCDFVSHGNCQKAILLLIITCLELISAPWSDTAILLMKLTVNVSQYEGCRCAFN